MKDWCERKRGNSPSFLFEDPYLSVSTGNQELTAYLHKMSHLLIRYLQFGRVTHRIKALASVRKLLIVENTIISCLDSNTIKMYSLENGKLIKRDLSHL